MSKKIDSMQLKIILSQIIELIRKHSLIAAPARNSYLLRLAALENNYTELDISESKEHKALFSSLLLKGERLLKELKSSKDAREINKKLSFYIKYLEASIYDFKGWLGGLNLYARCFTITAALFMALTPQFYGFVLPVFFFIPIFGGLRGVRRRSLTGLKMTSTVVPMAIMTSITWIRYFFQAALPNFAQEAATTSQTWNVSLAAAQLLIIIPGILSIFLGAFALMTAFFGYKYRRMFV